LEDVVVEEAMAGAVDAVGSPLDAVVAAVEVI
jgi:hypothetical protein